jgi:DNA-binding transcriptional ArsR family regulator
LEAVCVAIPKAGAELNAAFMMRVAKVLAVPLRIKIVSELNLREMSPKQFFEDFGGGTVSRVSRHFDVLVEYGWLYLVQTKSGGKRRGAVEHFYRATQPAVFNNDTWSPLPTSMKEMVSVGIFEELGERLKEALAAGTLDARDDRHFTWTPILADRLGWDEIVARVDELFEFLFEEQDRARVRLAETGEEPILMTVALAAFESPKDSKKAP